MLSFGAALRTARLLLALLILVAPLRALADASDSAALAQFEQGKSAYDAGKFEEALIAFQKSLSLLPSPNTRLYVARCHRALGHVASAYGQLRLASREAQDRATATGEKRFTATRDAAAGEAEELEPRVPRLTLAVPSTIPVDFSVKLDGKDLPRATWGAAIEIDPGRHTIRAGGARTRAFERTLDVAEGQRQRVEITLERVPTARLILDLKSRPSGLAIFVDGKPMDSSDFDKVRELDVGERRLLANAPGYQSFNWKQTLKDGQEVRLAIELRPAPRAASATTGTPPWLFFTAAGASLVAIGVGTVIAIDAKSQSDDELAKDRLLRDAETRDSIHDKSLLANGLFVTGALLAAGSGVLLFTTKWGSAENPPNRASRRRTWVGARGGALVVGGSY